MPNDGGKENGVSSWVPQLFYDIIARLVPGTFLTGTFALAAAGPDAALAAFGRWLTTRLHDGPGDSPPKGDAPDKDVPGQVAPAAQTRVRARLLAVLVVLVIDP